MLKCSLSFVAFIVRFSIVQKVCGYIYECTCRVKIICRNVQILKRRTNFQNIFSRFVPVAILSP